MEKLNDLSYTVSALTREALFFDLTQEGYLGLYLSLNGKLDETSSNAVSLAAT